MTTEETWRSKSDDEVAIAAASLANYTEVAQRIILDEVARRELTPEAIGDITRIIMVERINAAVRWERILARFAMATLFLNLITHLPVLFGSSTFAEGLLEFSAWLYIVTGLVFVAWLHRAYSNLRLVGTKQIAYGAGWAISCWLVPFLNFIRPYVITAEVWQKSSTKNSDKPSARARGGLIPGLWWLTFWASNFLETIGFYEGISHPLLWRSVDFLTIAAAGLAIFVVRGVDRGQRSFVDDLYADASPPNQPLQPTVETRGG